MLSYKLEGNILKVTQTIHGWKNTSTQTSEYNIETWQSRCNNDPWSPMVQGSIDWVKKYYFPKVGLLNSGQKESFVEPLVKQTYPYSPFN